MRPVAISRMKAVAAVMASLNECTSHSASRPKNAGSAKENIGGQIRLRERLIASALPVWRVLCQYEIMSMPKPARGKPQK